MPDKTTPITDTLASLAKLQQRFGEACQEYKTNYAPSVEVGIELEASRRLLQVESAAAWPALRDYITDLRDAIRLLIGRNINVPWNLVVDGEVDGYLAAIRELKAKEVLDR